MIWYPFGGRSNVAAAAEKQLLACQKATRLNLNHDHDGEDGGDDDEEEDHDHGHEEENMEELEYGNLITMNLYLRKS